MKEGDMLLCIQTSGTCEYRYQVVEGRKYIANGFITCKCGKVGVDIGLPWAKSPFGKKWKCLDCGDVEYCTSPFPVYDTEYFRVIEPEYRTVEISSEIKKQELQLN